MENTFQHSWFIPNSNKYLWLTLVDQSLTPLGYERDKHIRGAPYDFRKGPHELEFWFTDFKNLIEQTYQENGNTSVILLSHSMGGPMSLLLLQRVTKSWKDKYIRVSAKTLFTACYSDVL